MSPTYEDGVDRIDAEVSGDPFGLRPDLQEAIDLFVCNLDWRVLPVRFGDVYEFDKMLIDKHQAMLTNDVKLITGDNVYEILHGKDEVIKYFTHCYHKLYTWTIPLLTIATSDRVTCHTERVSDCAESQAITREDVMFIFDMTAANKIKRIEIRPTRRT
ncbi:hypothetical protein CkaCkLH20_11589 [Colletotrichum karsti]|uniref:Uncharacterized protein n=1 Tax=Colletotrichum karsti TaxID=1095194 RepID=A0A9P6LG04_9PEZI|nr:uncharacterized protein CkaCkLH20_11589 [Colletotrichum karsti]KAF9870917.1 hypothetical protein CkaCkLH20_11589 [Colletotrichum karsti]